MLRMGIPITALCAIGVLIWLQTRSHEQSTHQNADSPTSRHPTPNSESHAASAPNLPAMGSAGHEQAATGPQPSLAESEAAPVIHAMQQKYNTPQEKADAIVASLRNSGPAPTAFSQGGARLALQLKQSGLAADWECFGAGCYFRMNVNRPDLMREIISAREGAIPGYVVGLTPDDPPNKLAVLFNFKQD